MLTNNYSAVSINNNKISTQNQILVQKCLITHHLNKKSLVKKLQRAFMNLKHQEQHPR